ncbi:uncharacterized protein A4U43_C04F3720 [Asparagus officinalis]|uniref:Uncharacterized protein n=1 Tax=Asparagus officinalis TaxID=4686 RepID=A0A5P1EZU1_ASPOF|nr:uncharacterized protein A4U43_C04F3720 [Asparagus officinalis]
MRRRGERRRETWVIRRRPFLRGDSPPSISAASVSSPPHPLLRWPRTSAESTTSPSTTSSASTASSTSGAPPPPSPSVASSTPPTPTPTSISSSLTPTPPATMSENSPPLAERLVNRFCVVDHQSLFHIGLLFHYSDGKLVDHLDTSRNSLLADGTVPHHMNGNEAWRRKISSILPRKA